MDKTLWMVALGAMLLAPWLPAAKRRFELSRAKHRSLAGHSRMAKRVAKWVPFYAYGDDRFFSSDDAPAEIADRRNQPNPNRTDILALLMTDRDSQGQPLSDIELRFGINHAAVCRARNDGICFGLGAVLDSLPT